MVNSHRTYLSRTRRKGDTKSGPQVNGKIK